MMLPLKSSLKIFDMGFINNSKPNNLFRCLLRDIPHGIKNIFTNGLHDVAQYEKVFVDVPQGITPTGTKNITANGVYDITTYANVDVNVSGGLSNALTGSFVYNGGDVVIDLNLKQQLLKPTNIVIYDNNQSTLSGYSETPKSMLVGLTSPNMNTPSYTSVFNGSTTFTQYTPYLTTAQTSIAGSSHNTVFYFMTNGHDIIFSPNTNVKLIVGHTYNYIVLTMPITYDFSNSTCIDAYSPYNVGDTLSTALMIQNANVLVDNVSIGNMLNVSVRKGNNNVTVDDSAVDMSTAGTYYRYVTVDWNVTKSFAIPITVV